MAGEQFVRSLSALAVLGGHWQSPGGGLCLEASPVMNEAAAGRPDLGPVSRELDMARLGGHLTNPALAPPIAGFMIWNANPAVSQSDAARVRQGLAREDLFLVVVEHFLTDTARFADIVLPSTTQLEHFDVQGAWGHHYISANLPAIAPRGEAKSHGPCLQILQRHAVRQGCRGDLFVVRAKRRPLEPRGFIKSAPPRPVFGREGMCRPLVFERFDLSDGILALERAAETGGPEDVAGCRIAARPGYHPPPRHDRTEGARVF